jgi:predicted lipoprotein with Yx(FWY)xxD motif
MTMGTEPRLLTLIAAVVFAAGCGGADESPSPAAPPRDEPAVKPEAPRKAAKPRGTRLTVRDSPFGEMLFDSRRQAIYVFERDRRGASVCYGECARAWPPVLTNGKPVAGKGVDVELLGAIRRRGGDLQVTYAGRPLYFYAHEGPGQVLCHNVDLNGGLWWVVDPAGEPRP